MDFKTLSGGSLSPINYSQIILSTLLYFLLFFSGKLNCRNQKSVLEYYIELFREPYTTKEVAFKSP